MPLERHTLKAVGRLFRHSMSEQLPDSGAAYMDRDAGTPTGIAKRVFRSAKREVMSGDIGGEAVALVGGGALGAGMVWLWKNTVGDDNPTMRGN